MKSLEEMLTGTSRTFAITIPYLPEPERREITLAYLLLRIIDTLEDGVLWPVAVRARSLGEMVEFLVDPSPTEAVSLAIRWCDPPPCTNTGYLELLGSFPEIVSEIVELEPGSSAIICGHARRVAVGMAQSLNTPTLDLVSLRQYCYFVAGIVGELLTDLFLLRLNPTEEQAARLRELAVCFGEGLQLVNILKDAEADAREGRQYVPPQVDGREVFTLARRDLEAAAEYSQLLQSIGAPSGIVLFTAIPTAFAQATLDRVEQQGPGAKLSRSEVMEIRHQVETQLHGDR
ncbi:MAG TPA: squalene/phytoene synthase family protein [Gemmatales bacterium]|nr:squalene/phytoene synthase family protein [Gemmatales bacterium]